MTSEPSEKVPVEPGTDPEEFRARYDALLAAVDAGVCYLDHDGCITSANDEFVEMVGPSAAGVRGERLSAFFTSVGDESGDSRGVDSEAERLADASANADETTLAGTLTADGRPVEVRLRRVGTNDAGAAAVVAVVRDDGDTASGSPPSRGGTNGVAGLDDIERQFESLVDSVKEYAIFMLDPDGYVASWNQGARQIKGYEREEILGRHYATFFTETDVEAGTPQRCLSEARERGSVDMEGWRVRKDGSQFWASATLTAVRDDDGELVGYTKVTRDMSERREHRQQIREDRDLLHQVLATSPVGITVIAEDGSIVRSNDERRTFTGLTEDSHVDDLDIYDADGEFVPPEDRPHARVFETGEPITDWLGQIDTEDGHRWVNVNATPLTDTSGDVERVVITVEDVTEFKEQEARLERQRDELTKEVTEMFERITDAFFGLNRNWEFTYVNDQAEELLGVPAEELTGEYVWDLFDEASADQFREQYEYAIEHQEPVDFEAYYEEPLDAWFQVSAYPSETGLSVYFRDVTERKEYERELAESEERYRTLVDNLPDGVVAVFDQDMRYTLAGGGLFDDIDVSPEEMIGNTLSEAFPDMADQVLPAYRSALAGEDTVVELEFDDHVLETHVRPIRGDDGEVVAGMNLVLDVTERRENERELRRYEQIVETVWDGVYALDDEGKFVLVNDAFLDLTGYDRDELMGQPAEMTHNDEIKAVAERMAEEVTRGEREVGVLEFDLVTKGGDTVPIESRFGPYQYSEDSSGRTGVVRDITDRRQREKELQTRIRQQEVITELGQYAIRAEKFDDILQRATELVSETLGTDYCKVLDLDADDNELLLRAGVGWTPGLVGEATVRADTNSQAGYTLLTDGPVVVDDLASESRFTGPDLLFDHDVTSGISTIIGSPDEPWGILGTHDREDKGFTDNDVAFVQSVTTILTNAVERERQKRELEHQREQLAALNQLNRVVQGINRAVVEKSSREEIEDLVCDRLADTYKFAWIGEVGRGNREVMVRTEAGVENYLSDITLDIDDEVTSQGPTAAAIRTREMQVAKNIPENGDYPWQDHAESHSYRSSAAIPIVHEGSLYGVLNIYSERPDAFDGQEGAVLSQLGDIVGHAINSVERKQALVSDEMVELEFYLPDVTNAVGISEEHLGGEIRFERTIPTGDGEYLVYGSMTADARDMMDVLCEELPHFADVRILAEETDEITFELKLSDPPAISVMADHGGRVVGATIAGSDYEMRVHLPQTADVREVVTALQEVYPDVELVAQRRTTKSDTEQESGPATLAADLTDRQHAVLEAAFRSGFFEWPRESTGEDIADSVGITASTLHQHLRAAERKLVDTYLDG